VDAVKGRNLVDFPKGIRRVNSDFLGKGAAKKNILLHFPILAYA
jgi:hypothetical protein